MTRQLRVFGRQVHTYEVIDGQQRLTTLQVFLAACRDYLRGSDSQGLEREFERLTRNDGVVEEEVER